MTLSIVASSKRCWSELMNKIHPKKLLQSKWTAVIPNAKEKHFLIIEVEYSEEGMVESCVMEAVMSKRQMQIDWRDLKQSDIWLQGWK